MINPTFIEVNRFICAILSGVLAGVLFDIYRVIKGDEQSNPIITFISDVLFWILTSILVFIFLLYTNYAYVSIYIYLLIFLGLFGYLKLFSRGFSKVLRKIINETYSFTRAIFKGVLYPINILKYSITKKKKKI